MICWVDFYFQLPHQIFYSTVWLFCGGSVCCRLVVQDLITVGCVCFIYLLHTCFFGKLVYLSWEDDCFKDSRRFLIWIIQTCLNKISNTNSFWAPSRVWLSEPWHICLVVVSFSVLHNASGIMCLSCSFHLPVRGFYLLVLPSVSSLTEVKNWCTEDCEVLHELSTRPIDFPNIHYTH